MNPEPGTVPRHRAETPGDELRSQMNYRVFSSEADLHAGVGEAIDRVTASSLSPYIGIVGALPEWLGSHLARMSKRPHLAGYPEPVQTTIDRYDELLPAEARDLDEPLDLVVIVGPPPASEPPWMNEARMIFIAIDRQEDLAIWTRRSGDSKLAWFFVREEHWEATVTPIGRKDHA